MTSDYSTKDSGTATSTSMGVGRGGGGPGFRIFQQKKTVFLVSSGKNQTSPLLAPPRKSLGKSLVPPTGKILPTPMSIRRLFSPVAKAVSCLCGPGIHQKGLCNRPTPVWALCGPGIHQKGLCNRPTPVWALIRTAMAYPSKSRRIRLTLLGLLCCRKMVVRLRLCHELLLIAKSGIPLSKKRLLL